MAPISESLRVVLQLLEKVTRMPESVTPADIHPVLALGVTRDAIRDSLYVAFLFNTYDRLADTLGWELPEAGYYPRAGQFLLKRGYV